MSIRKIPPRRRSPRHQKPPGDYIHLAEIALEDVGLTWSHVLWYKRSYNGRITYRGRLAAPEPHSIGAIYVLVHELGHLALHFDVLDDGRLKLRPGRTHVVEFEAEQYALGWFDIHGVEAPFALHDVSKKFVARHVRADAARGVEIEYHIAEWAGVGADELARLRPPVVPQPPRLPEIDLPSIPLQPAPWLSNWLHSPGPQPDAPPRLQPLPAPRRSGAPAEPSLPVPMEVRMTKAPPATFWGRLAAFVREVFCGSAT